MRNFAAFCRSVWIIAKYRLLSHPGSLKLPWLFRAWGIKLDLLTLRLPFIKPKQSFGHRLNRALTELGPIYIKFGQTLSTRPDLVGQEVAQHLAKLQDRLPPFAFKHVEQEFIEQFGLQINEVFLTIDHAPVAAASISQVHKGQLKSGDQVALKVLRPGIEKQYQRDITLLFSLARLADRFTKKYKRLKFVSVIEIFQKTMIQELDLRMEAAAASEMRDDFSNDETIYIPTISWEYTAQTILTLEWVDGISIYDKEAIVKMGLKPVDIATKLAVMFFHQAYQNGFFHADLHPGNILVSRAGNIILLDFGIMGRLDRANRLAVSEILEAFLRRDYMRLAQIHKNIGYIPEDTNLHLFAQSFRAIAEPILGKAAKDISIGRLLAHLFKVTEDYGMQTQPQLLLLQKTTIVVEGIGKTLDSNINLWQLAEPWIKEWTQKNISLEAKLADFIALGIKRFLEYDFSKENGKK